MQFTWITAEARKEQKRIKQRKWHKWFALKPVRLDIDINGKNTSKSYGIQRYAFFETVYRKTNIYSPTGFTYISKQEYMKQILKGK